MSQNIHDPEMTKLETALKALDPRPATLDRDRLMFLAGHRSAVRRGWLLPCLSAALASAATLLAVVLLWQPEPRIVRMPAPMAPIPSSPQPTAVLAINDTQWEEQAKALRLRNDILQRGIEALPPPSFSDARTQPLSIDNLLQ